MKSSAKGRNRLLIAGFLLIGCVVAILLIRAMSPPSEDGRTDPADPSQIAGEPVARSGRSPTDGQEDYAGSMRVARILGDPLLEDRAVRDSLLELACDRSARTEEREEALSHALNLSPDEDTGMLADVLSEGDWTNELLQVFLDDFMNRPDPGRLTLLVEVMAVAKTPVRNEVRETLAFLLDQDPGDDIEAWREAVRTWSADESR